MNINEKFNELLDGSLSSQDEESLFSVLGKSAEARGDFKQSLAIEFGVQRDALDIAPSREATNKIFSALDIESVTHNPIVKSATAISLFSSRIKIFAAAIVSSLITALLMFNFGTGEGRNVNQFAQYEYLNQAKPLSLTIELPSEVKYITSEVASFSVPEKSVPEKEKQSFSNNNFIASEGLFEKENTQSSILSADPNSDINFAGIASNYVRFPRLFFSTEYKKEDGLYDLGEFSSSYKVLGFINNITIRVNKYYDNLYTNGYSISPNSTSGYDNISLSFIYNYSKTTKFGLELRRENIFKDNSKNSISGDIAFEQQSSITGGLLMNRDLYRFNDFARTYFDVAVGYNPDILLLRTGVGAELRIFKDFFFSAGVQLSQFTFTDNDNKGFWGSKTSFYSGINYDM
jgi:hypothetical protein